MKTKLVKEIAKDLESKVDIEKKEVFPKFFKSGKGEYGEGDLFYGISVPDCRLVAKKYLYISLKEIQELLESKMHEERLVALMILVEKFEKALNDDEKKVIVDFYLSNTNRINNWDLVDLSCYKILGAYLLDKPKDILYTLAKSKNLWERRIAIVSTMAFIRKNMLDDTYKIADILLDDKHDLIQKATGWLLREAGKKDQSRLEKFIRANHLRFGRTALRYSIEKFDEQKRKAYLALK